LRTVLSTQEKAMTKTATRTDIYARVTDRIISDLEHGVRPWLRPWHATHTDGRITLPRRHNGTPYRGINILLLWAEMIDKGYASDTWMTFRQALALKAHVRKGEHGSTVVYADRVTKTEKNDQGEEVEQEIPFLKAYTVFNVEQIEDLPTSYQVPPERIGEPLALIARAETFFATTGATIRHGGNRAYYAPGPDVIQLPPAEAFRDAESYAATKAHEMTHWTAHPSRLARVLGKRFGDDAYAAEELIAELGAAFLCADLGITPEPREDHAAYLDHWLKVLRADTRAIFAAAAHAQRAVDYLRGMPKEAAA
jgi:antirestriction protein ArdC